MKKISLKRLRKPLTTLLIAFIAIAGFVGCVEKAADVVVSPQAIIAPKVPYYAHLDVTDVEASTWYILVDLSDGDNFPHVGTTNIILKQLCYTGVLSEAGHFDVRFGVVGTISDNGAHVEFFHTMHGLRTTQFDERLLLPERGLSLSLDSDDELQFVASMEYTDTTAVTTTTVLDSPVFETDVVTPVVGVGDIVMYLEEVDVADNALDISVGVAYDTE